ncbi:hypothetical protein LguiA_024560 [Lonicera macranthoides]
MTTGCINPTTTGSYHIVAIPYPGRGHINPMMNICTLLASKGITVTVVLTEEWLGLIGSVPDTPNIRLRTIPNVVPSEHNRAANFVAFVEAVYSKMEAPFIELLDRLELPASCLVADVFLPWITHVGNPRNIPVVLLWTMAASTFNVFSKMNLSANASEDFPNEDTPEVQIGEETTKDPSPVSAMDLANKTIGTISKTSFFKRAFESFSSSDRIQAIFFASFYELEPHEVNNLRAQHPNIPLYTIGPSIPHISLNFPSHFPTTQTGYFPWLDSQPDSSVLYVSLGSFLSTSDGQMLELSKGLQSTGFKFLWVTRNEALGLQKDCGEMGLVVSWCDQLRVLCHSSIGGFLTHCGWNSTMEGIFAGVPMITFPLIADQIHNSKLIVEEWKIGVKLKEIEGKENLVGREEIVKSVKKLMDLSGEESIELRSRAKDLKESCRRAIEKGGSSDNNINDFIKEFVQGKFSNAK